MLPLTRKVVSPKEFDRLFGEEARIAKFSSKEEEKAYEKRVEALTSQIRRVCEEQFKKDEDDQPHVIDDWWPDHTRGMEATPEHCTLHFFDSVHGLLEKDYKHFRIQICVYRDANDGESYIGSLLLYADRIVIEKKLESLLNRSLPKSN